MNNRTRGYAPVASTRPDIELSTARQGAGVSPAVIVALILAIVVNFLVLRNIHLPIVRPALGFWFVIIFPSYLVFTTAAWRRCSFHERLGYSVCGTLLILMLTGFAMNEVLPLVDVQRPLDAVPVLIASDLINLSIYVIRSRYPDRVGLHGAFAEFGKEEFRLLVAALLTVVLAILGANHLNNGASGHVALVALALVALVIILSLRWLKHTRDSMMSIVFYLVSLSLLLTTSLRGWYVTGHDIQQEYQVFQLTEARGHWSMAYFHNAYNACLSITILPTELGQIVNVDSPYVYKFFFQLIFALCPVLAYGIARRYFNRGISTLAFAYFVGFPTFFTDMPFLNRQEIGFLFVAVALLIVTNPVWSLRKRQIGFVIAGLGIEISHYSTMYVFIGTLIISLLCSYAVRLMSRSDSTDPDVSRGGKRWRAGPKNPVTIGVVTTLIGVILVWGTLVTGTTGQILNDSSGAISAGNFSLNLFGKAAISPGQAMNNLRQSSLKSLSSAPQGTYLPTSAVAQATTPVVAQQLNPLTVIGRAATSVGIPVIALNSFARNFVAYGEQLFLGIGLLRLFIVGRRRRAVVDQHFFWLCIGNVTMIALITVLPSIAADYGLLRAFQQGLLFFSPIIVIGSMTIFDAIARYRARIAACVISLGIYLATSTVVPQILGGNLAELNLNNSGQYYDLFYMTAQQESAVGWLSAQPDVLAYPIQATFQQKRWSFTSLNDVNANELVADAYPTEVLQDSWVLLGNPTTNSGVAYTYTPSNGATTEYKYPIWILDNYKNVVFTDGAAVVYK